MASKKNEGKPPLALVSRDLVEELARVREFGAIKYERDNWRKGFPYTTSLNAALRHIFLFLDRQDTDPESNLGHLGHAVANLEHVIYMERHPELRQRFDDRPAKNDPKNDQNNTITTTNPQ